MDYDPNGNIKKLKRYSQVGMPTHNFDYQYNTVADAKKTNQLESISGYSNYKYNALGQMAEEYKDAGDEQFVEYDVTGKVTRVYATKNATTGTFEDLKVEFIYDDRGFRLAKKNYAKVNGTDAVQRTTWYIRDASGNVISVYEEDNVDNILTETEVPVYGSGKLGTYYPNQDGSTAYEITDHLGNVRALVRDNVEIYTATMEDNGQVDIANPRVSEMLYFENLFETEVTDSRMNHTKPGGVPAPDKAAYLYWVDGMEGIQAADKAVGPAIALKVNAGDKIDVETWVRYERKVNYSKNFSLATLASLIGGSFAYTAGFEGSTLSQTAQSLNGALTAAAYPDDGGDDTRPFAYLNYIVYDKDMVYKNAGWLRVTDDAGFDPGEEGLPDDHEHLKFDALNIAQDGFIYVWVNNQSEATKVWFDDLTVSHRGTILAQATDYGVWGDILREQKTDLSTYRHGYQGQFSEKDEETGWNHFELREYDPVIGRWTARDPYRQFWSPYSAMGNMPTVAVDHDGGFKTWFGAWWRSLGMDATPYYDALEEEWAIGWTSTIGTDNGMPVSAFMKLTEIEGEFSEFTELRDAAGQVWNHPITRFYIPDYYSIGVGYSGFAYVGAGTSFELNWVLRGPEASILPILSVTEQVGIGWDADVTLNATSTNYIGPVEKIRAGMINTVVPNVNLYSNVGISNGVEVAIGVNLEIDESGALLMGRSVSVGLGLPGGHGSAGVQNTKILHSFSGFK